MLGLLLDAAMPLPILLAEREIVIDMMKVGVRFAHFQDRCRQEFTRRPKTLL